MFGHLTKIRTKEELNFMLRNLQESGLAETFKENNKTSIRILDLGCGPFTGFLTLDKYFSKQGIEIKYHGVDINPGVITNNLHLCRNRPNASFYCVDASHPNNLKSLELKSHSADLVVCLHPLTEDEGVQNMLRQTLPYYLSFDGHVYMSFYESKEFNDVCNLKSNECFVFPKEKNECRITQRKNEITYLSLVPLKFDKILSEEKSETTILVSEEKPENTPLVSEEKSEKKPALSKCGLFKAKIASGLANISKTCCCFKPGKKH